MNVNQHYLFEARQMQALSLAVHIPLVCFGIAFPVIVLFAEWRDPQTRGEPFRALARRGAPVLVAPFAGGVVAGTILSLVLAVLWAGWVTGLRGRVGPG